MKNVVLIHGWNYRNYTKFGCNDSWSNRSNFINELEKHFNVTKLNLPGFCGKSEPNNRSWNLDDFSNFFQNFLSKNNIVPDFVLGYSFGGAVALNWKSLFPSKTKLILISPAISRAYSDKNISANKSKKFIPKPLLSFLKNIYLRFVVKNPYHIHGTPFLRKTYQNIVRVDLSQTLNEKNPDDFICIFGSDDTATPPKILLSKVSDQVRKRIKIINGGGHDIANSHTDELIKLIQQFIDT